MVCLSFVALLIRSPHATTLQDASRPSSHLEKDVNRLPVESVRSACLKNHLREPISEINPSERICVICVKKFLPICVSFWMPN